MTLAPNLRQSCANPALVNFPLCASLAPVFAPNILPCIQSLSGLARNLHYIVPAHACALPLGRGFVAHSLARAKPAPKAASDRSGARAPSRSDAVGQIDHCRNHVGDFGMPFALPANPAIGASVARGSQKYECVEIREAVRKDGQTTLISVWNSRCPSCGETFKATASFNVGQSASRRCAACARPGAPVAGRRTRVQADAEALDCKSEIAPILRRSDLGWSAQRDEIVALLRRRGHGTKGIFKAATALMAAVKETR